MNRPEVVVVGRVLAPGATYIGADGIEHTITAPFPRGFIFSLVDPQAPGAPGINGKADRAWSIEELARLAVEAGTYQPGDWLPD